MGLAFYHTSTRTCLCPVNNNGFIKTTNHPESGTMAPPHIKIMQCRAHHWLVGSFTSCIQHMSHRPTRDTKHTHIHLQDMPTKQWMLDFNVSQPHLCLKMISCHWGKQTDKHWAFLGRVCTSTSCDSGCLPTVAGEHSYMHSGSGIWIFAQWYHSQHIDGDHMCVLDRSPVALSRLCIRYNPCCHCKR